VELGGSSLGAGLWCFWDGPSDGWDSSPPATHHRSFMSAFKLQSPLEGGGAAEWGETKMARCVVIPSIAVSMLPDFTTLAFSKLTWSEFVEMLARCDKIVNFVRHKPTNDLLLTVVTTFETGFEYRINVDDTIFMIGLKGRAPTPGADVSVSPNDLLIYLAKPIK
jgi:hypothetical protein